MADTIQTVTRVLSKENAIVGGKILLGLAVSETINYSGDYAVRKLSKGKYKMPHEIGGVVTALIAGAGFKDMHVVAAGLGDAGLNLLWDVVGFNILDPVNSAEKLAGKTTDTSAKGAPGTSSPDIVFAS